MKTEAEFKKFGEGIADKIKELLPNIQSKSAEEMNKQVSNFQERYGEFGEMVAPLVQTAIVLPLIDVLVEKGLIDIEVYYDKVQKLIASFDELLGAMMTSVKELYEASIRFRIDRKRGDKWEEVGKVPADDPNIPHHIQMGGVIGNMRVWDLKTDKQIKTVEELNDALKVEKAD